MTEQKNRTVLLRELVRQHGYNRTYRDAGISLGTFARIVSGESVPTPENRDRLAGVYELESQEIVFPADAMTAEERRAKKIRRQVLNLWGPEIAGMLPEAPRRS